MPLTLASPAFENDGTIPAKYTCDLPASRQVGARDVSPPLSIRDAPEGTKSFVLIMDDYDIPNIIKRSGGADAFDHWVVYNIPADTTEIPEGAVPGQEGLSSAGEIGYTAPCPPPQYEPKEHRYIFTLYALGGELTFVGSPTKQQVLDALAPVLLASAELTGRYARK